MRNLKRFIALLCTTVVLMAALTLSGCRALPKPEETAQRFLSLWQKQQYSDMYELLTADVKASIDKQTFTTRYKNIFDAMKLQGMEYNIGAPVIPKEDKK